MKNKNSNKKVNKEEIIKEKKIETNNTDVSISNWKLLSLTGILSILYYVFSTFSDGFYQHDEVANFIMSQSIWHDDFSSIFGANSKTGFRLLYALPALGGFTFLKIFNSILAAFTVYFSYKILHKLNVQNGILIFFLLGLQPLWFMLSFRNYAELLVAFLIVLSVLQFYNKKYIVSALIISYVAFTRQEYHVLSGLLFFVLLVKKEWIAAVLTGIFTALQNLIGYIQTGDLLYVYTQSKEFSERIKDEWPKQGFEHYFEMSNVIFGSVALTLFVAYIGIKILKREKPNWLLSVPIIVVLLVNCAFNMQSINFGPGNGGNLRYLITVSPLLAIIGVLAVQEISNFNKKYLLLIFLIPLLILVGVYQSYEHNFVHLSEVRNWKPFLFSVLTVVLLILPLKLKQYIIAFSLIIVFEGFTSITSRKIQPEEQTVEKAARWYKNHITLTPPNEQLFTADSRVVCGHTLFYYYLNQNKNEFKNKAIDSVTKEVTDSLKKGDLLIWESHYGYRPNLRPTSQPYEFYQNNPNFQRIQYYQSSDNRFTIVFFRKITD